MLHENRGKFVFGMSLVGLLLLVSPAVAQKKPVSPTPAKVVASAPQPAPVVTDGRTVKVEGVGANGARVSSEAVAKVQASFNRRLPRDLRTYTLAEVLSAAEAAAADGTTTGSTTARPRICIRLTCCPWTITIIFNCNSSMN